MASVQRAIKIYARLKPNIGLNPPYEISTADVDSGEELLKLSSLKPQDENQFVNNKPDNFTFRFSKVFDRKTTQDAIFDEIARPVIDSCLLGYNGTIFAYGQTGSGKTFTMTGSRNVYEDRGVIPRTLQYIFNRFKEEEDASKIRAVFVSYLEIYNESGYDLLHSSTMPGQLEDLVKVTLMEDGNQQMHLKNLSVHPIDSVEEATQLLYLGDHNRTIAETPLNEVSTRSHCIFTIHLNIRDGNSSIVRRSKLHLVDLAGSERVSNTSVSGHLFTESRHINLALHYLEQVIVALGESNRQHIPYRNSMMTSVLRDSLGGNCMTTMIATIALEQRNVQESLSTCRFSQRVALVTNAAIPNEELDPNVVIAQLKSEVKKLKEIIGSSIVKPMKENSSPLNPDEKADCSSLVDGFLRDGDPEAILPILPDMRMIQECFRLLKSRAGDIKPTKSQKLYGVTSKGKEKDNSTLIQTIARRDAEIRVLMDMLRNEKSKRGEYSSGKNTANTTRSIVSLASAPAMSRNNAIKRSEGNVIDAVAESIIQNYPNSAVVGPAKSEDSVLEELSEVKRNALSSFMENYHGTQPLEQLRNDLTAKRAELTALQETVDKKKSNIDSMKELLTTSQSPNDKTALNSALSSTGRTYDLDENKLVTKREEILKMQESLTKLYQNLMSDFETWWNKTSQINVRDAVSEKKPLSNFVGAFKRPQVETISTESGQQQADEGLNKVIDWTASSHSLTTISLPETIPKNIRKDPDGTWNMVQVKPSPKVPPVTPESPTNKAMLAAKDEAALKKLPLTGDPKTDEQIIKFFRARKQIFRKNNSTAV